jgi:hypothetical protein
MSDLYSLYTKWKEGHSDIGTHRVLVFTAMLQIEESLGYLLNQDDFDFSSIKEEIRKDFLSDLDIVLGEALDNLGVDND